MVVEKSWYKSKAMWAGIFLIVTAVYQFATTGDADYQQIISVLTGLGIIGIRQAEK